MLKMLFLWFKQELFMATKSKRFFFHLIFDSINNDSFLGWLISSKGMGF
jgi:hypothetical protein